MASLKKIAPFLWYEDRAKEAVEFYCSLFPDSEMISCSSMVIEFKILGLEMMAMNGGPGLTESFSLMVSCEDQREVDKYWNALTANGGKEIRCGWLVDPFGLSWQIIPKSFIEKMRSGDREAGKRMMEALMGMVKLDIAALEAAYYESN